MRRTLTIALVPGYSKVIRFNLNCTFLKRKSGMKRIKSLQSLGSSNLLRIRIQMYNITDFDSLDFMPVLDLIKDCCSSIICTNIRSLRIQILFCTRADISIRPCFCFRSLISGMLVIRYLVRKLPLFFSCCAVICVQSNDSILILCDQIICDQDIRFLSRISICNLENSLTWSRSIDRNCRKFACIRI